MEVAENKHLCLYIDSVRDDIQESHRELEQERNELALTMQAVEELTVDTCSLRVRMKELEFDEELLKQSEQLAVQDKLMAEKRLMEVGGYERVVRVLQKALQDAKQELQDTKDEKVHVMNEEKKLQQELGQLNSMLKCSQLNSVRLQEEYSTIMKSKRETDEKLQRLSLFLRQTIETSAAQTVKAEAITAGWLPSPMGSPTSTAMTVSPRTASPVSAGSSSESVDPASPR